MKGPIHHECFLVSEAGHVSLQPQLLSLFQEKQAELQSAVIRVDQGTPTDSPGATTGRKSPSLSGPAAVELRKLYQELQARNRHNLEQSSKLVQNKELLNKRNAQVTVMDQRIGDLRERLHKKKAEPYERRRPVLPSDLHPSLRWRFRPTLIILLSFSCLLAHLFCPPYLFLMLRSLLLIQHGGTCLCDSSSRCTCCSGCFCLLVGLVVLHGRAEEDRSGVRKPSSQWKVSDLDIVLSEPTETWEGPLSPQAGDGNNSESSWRGCWAPSGGLAAPSVLAQTRCR
ncbi:hypothetical protein GOODEAATRI_022311 [Goodea atripinnis]|uniref:Uncharacterized protein n=1 Tax=Goodea atripinnis TaxID=208336 RepID=A0ABV0Q049_9TELE